MRHLQRRDGGVRAAERGRSGSSSIDTVAEDVDDTDQRFIETALPDAAHGMLAALPSMRTPRGQLLLGKASRSQFGVISTIFRRRSARAAFAKAWQTDSAGLDFLAEGIRRWRQQARTRITLNDRPQELPWDSTYDAANLFWPQILPRRPRTPTENKCPADPAEPIRRCPHQSPPVPPAGASPVIFSRHRFVFFLISIDTQVGQ